MTTAATRSHVRHAGDATEFYAERDRKAAKRSAELEARQEAFRAEHPEIAARIAKGGRRRR